MAKKTTKMQMTPIMSLAVLALFAMMIPIFSISNTQSDTRTSSAQVPTPTATPEAMDELMMEK